MEVDLPFSVDMLLGQNPSRFGRRSIERLDLLLLVIEAIDLYASQAMLSTSKNIGLDEPFSNRVELWKRRCHNPLRRAHRRGILQPEDCDSLVLLICSMSDRLYPALRQLLSSKEPIDLHRQRWDLLRNRLNELLSERMNIGRGAVQKLLQLESNHQLHRELVISLAFSAGAGGVQRLKASLLDQNFC